MLKSLFAAHIRTLQERTEQAMARGGFEQLAIHSGIPKVAFQDDYHYHFKPNFNFVHYAPLTHHPHSFVVLKRDAKPQLIFMQPRDYWHVVPSDPDGFWVDQFDIQIIRTPAEAKTLITNLSRTAFIGEDVAAFQEWGFAAFNPSDVLSHLHWLRAYKTDYEIACIAEANRIATRAHRAAQTAFEQGASEYAIHLAYLQASGHMETELPYGNIVALNEHGAILHYTELQRQKPAQSRSFLIDAGASSNGYAADITRSYSREAGEFADMIRAMDAMEQQLIADLKPGKAYLDVHLEAHLGVAKILLNHDIVHGISAEAMVAEGISSTFYPHGIGHLLGLQVHDIGGRFLNDKGEPNPPPTAHPFLRMTRTIEAGMVFTIEPGLYFIDLLLDERKNTPQQRHLNWQKIAALKPFGGIRIEDNVVVGVQANRNLTREAFSAL